jgi:hypothetical protein
VDANKYAWSLGSGGGRETGGWRRWLRFSANVRWCGVLSGELVAERVGRETAGERAHQRRGCEGLCTCSLLASLYTARVRGESKTRKATARGNGQCTSVQGVAEADEARRVRTRNVRNVTWGCAAALCTHTSSKKEQYTNTIQYSTCSRSSTSPLRQRRTCCHWCLRTPSLLVRRQGRWLLRRQHTRSRRRCRQTPTRTGSRLRERTSEIRPGVRRKRAAWRGW